VNHGGEYGSLTDTPSAQEAAVPSALSIRAEEVLEGVRRAIRALGNSAVQEHLTGQQRLEIATHKLLKWLEDLPKNNSQAFITVVQPLEVHRLGRLLNGEYALFDGPAKLIPSKKNLINYIYGHNPPRDTEHADTLQGTEFQGQLYLGYAPPSINDMDGYALSLNRILTLEAERIVQLGAEEAADLQLPYYRGFPNFASVSPTERT
jgi:hypothetical protein